MASAVVAVYSRRKPALTERRCSSKQRSGVGSHHCFANERNGRTSITQKRVVELLPTGFAAPESGPVVTEFADHQLAERVVEIGRIECAAGRLLARGSGILVGFFAEQSFGCLCGHSSCVKSDGRQVAGVSKQRILELSDVRLGVAIAQAEVPHHFL